MHLNVSQPETQEIYLKTKKYTIYLYIPYITHDLPLNLKYIVVSSFGVFGLVCFTIVFALIFLSRLAWTAITLDVQIYLGSSLLHVVFTIFSPRHLTFYGPLKIKIISEQTKRQFNHYRGR